MGFSWSHLLRRRHGLPVALWLLLFLSANALQVVAATHWHSTAVSPVAGAGSPQPLPAPDGLHQDDCALCQVAAHAGSSAPPPAPWSLYTIIESDAASLQVAQLAAPLPLPSHSWQGRAPPQV